MKMPMRVMRPNDKAQGLAAEYSWTKERNGHPNWDVPGQFPEAPCSGRCMNESGAKYRNADIAETPSVRRFALESGDGPRFSRVITLPSGEDIDQVEIVP